MKGEHWYERKRREVEAYVDAIYDRWVREATIAAYIVLPLPDTTWIVCGYDPQRLLPAPSFERMFLANLADALGITAQQMNEEWNHD